MKLKKRMKQQTVALLVLVLLGLVSQVALALPDLVVTHIGIQPLDPVPGSPITIVSIVENVGHDDVNERLYVQFTVDGVEFDAAVLPFGIDAGRRKEVSATWIAQPGPHVIGVEADSPLDRVAEEDEENNREILAIVVPFSSESASRLASLRIVVAQFDDRSGSGFVNLGDGIADKLTERLLHAGLRVLAQAELEAIMQQRGLNPAFGGDIAAAAKALGADLYITGVVENVVVQQMSLSLGIIQFGGASSDVTVSAQLVNVHTSEILSSLSVEGHDEGATGFSVNVGNIRSLSNGNGACIRGLRTDSSWYYVGNTVPIGYYNPSLPRWFSIEIHSGPGAFVRWLGWQYIGNRECGRWFWDQRDATAMQMIPGIYTAKLWDGTSYIAETTFQIRPGSGLTIPLFDEITVGSDRFESTIVGASINQAVDQLTGMLFQSLDDIAPLAAGFPASETFAAISGEAFSDPREGQIAAILPNDRVAINIGTSSGVAKGDFFQVLEVDHLILDPQTQKILSYELLSIKGEIVTVEVRDRVAYAMRTSDFEPSIGDVIRPAGP